MRKILFALLAVVLVQSACKKEEGCTDKTATNFNSEAEEDDGGCTFEKTNKEKIVGDWDEIENYYINNADGIKQYAPSNSSYNCDDTTMIEYTPLYAIESIEWKFNADGTFSNLELAKTFTPTSSACSDGNNPDNYYGEDVVNKLEGTYEINDEGNGDIITFTIYDGEVYFNATILNLDESSIDFEYTIDGVKQRFIMKK